MFFHNFKYTLKILFKDKMLIFWTFFFPIILGTFFYMAFSDIEKNEKLDLIKIAIVDNSSFRENSIYQKSFQMLGDRNNVNRVFKIKYVTLKEAKRLLEDSQITGYLLLEDDVFKVVVSSNGINETIFKYVTDEVEQTGEILKDIAQKEIQEYLQAGLLDEGDNFNFLYANVYRNVLDTMQKKDMNIQDISSDHLSYTMIEFYTLIAMACLYGGILSMVVINHLLANMSSEGKRISICKMSKTKLILSSLLASYLAQLVGLFLLFVYTIFILKVDYGQRLWPVISLTLMGALAGLALGVFIACVFRLRENTKTGIMIAITMLGCFFSGMMGITMKYLIDQNFPIINRINPASMITDGFYSLYYYDTMNRFYFDLLSLGVFALIMIGLAIVCLRRKKYDYI